MRNKNRKLQRNCAEPENGREKGQKKNVNKNKRKKNKLEKEIDNNGVVHKKRIR